MQAPLEAHVNGIVEDVAEMHPQFGLQLRGRAAHDFVTQMLPTLLAPNYIDDAARAASPPAAAANGKNRARSLSSNSEGQAPTSKKWREDVEAAGEHGGQGVKKKHKGTGSEEESHRRKEKPREKRRDGDISKAKRRAKQDKSKQAEPLSSPQQPVSGDDVSACPTQEVPSNLPPKVLFAEDDASAQLLCDVPQQVPPKVLLADNDASAQPVQEAPRKVPPKMIIDAPQKVAFDHFDTDLEMALNTPGWAEGTAPVMADANVMAMEIDTDAGFLERDFSDPWDVEQHPDLMFNPSNESLQGMAQQAAEEDAQHKRDSEGSKQEDSREEEEDTQSETAAMEEMAANGRDSWALRHEETEPVVKDESWFSEFLESNSTVEDEGLPTQDEYEHLAAVYLRLREVLNAGLKRLKLRQQGVRMAATSAEELQAKVLYDREMRQHGLHLDRCKMALEKVHARLARVKALVA
jgi:hypothetical protein